MNFDKKRRSRVQGGWANCSKQSHSESTSVADDRLKSGINLNTSEDIDKDSENNGTPTLASSSLLNKESVLLDEANSTTIKRPTHSIKKFVYKEPGPNELIPKEHMTNRTVFDSDSMSGARSKFPALLEMVKRSKSYTHKFIDSHCHIDLLYSRFHKEKNYCYSKFISEHTDSFPSNYEGCIAIFCDPKTFDDKEPDTDTLRMASHIDNVWLALGCHPKNATRFSEGHLRGLRRALGGPRVVALGEVGLDYSGTFVDLADIQKSVLRCQISLALELNLPLVIHCRDADEDCLDILKEMVPRDWRIHRHCFTQDTDTALRWTQEFSNMFVGFTPLICKNNNSVAAIRQAAAEVPLNRCARHYCGRGAGSM